MGKRARESELLRAFAFSRCVTHTPRPRAQRARAHLTKLPMTELIQPAPQHGTMRSRSMFELCRPMPVLSGQLLTLA